MKSSAAISLIFAAVVGVASPASAAPSVSVDIADATLWNDCFHIPATVSVVGESPAVRFEGTVSLHDPRGIREELGEDPELADFLEFMDIAPARVAGSVRAGGTPSVKTVQLGICGFEGSGLWRADVKVDFIDADDNVVNTAISSDVAVFTQAPTHTALRRARSGEFVIRSSVDSPTGVSPCRLCWVRLQQKDGRNWTTVAQGFTGRRGRFETGVKPEPRAKYRAVTRAFGVARSEIVRRRGR